MIRIVTVHRICTQLRNTRFLALSSFSHVNWIYFRPKQQQQQQQEPKKKNIENIICEIVFGFVMLLNFMQGNAWRKSQSNQDNILETKLYYHIYFCIIHGYCIVIIIMTFVLLWFLYKLYFVVILAYLFCFFVYADLSISVSSCLVWGFECISKFLIHDLLHIFNSTWVAHRLINQPLVWKGRPLFLKHCGIGHLKN